MFQYSSAHSHHCAQGAREADCKGALTEHSADMVCRENSFIYSNSSVPTSQCWPSNALKHECVICCRPPFHWCCYTPSSKCQDTKCVVASNRQLGCHTAHVCRSNWQCIKCSTIAWQIVTTSWCAGLTLCRHVSEWTHMTSHKGGLNLCCSYARGSAISWCHSAARLG